MKILYAGDSPVGGPANYLLAILNHMNASVHHVPPGKKISAKILKTKPDAIIFSDYGSDCVSPSLAQQITDMVHRGTGFLMVGGWGSFSGPYGKWRGTFAEHLLPVKMSSKDDRLNFPGGALLLHQERHAALTDVTFKNPPAICGLNQLKAKPGARTLVTVKSVKFEKKIKLGKKEYPLLVVSSHPKMRTAAFASDFAPHWCGGLVDWGTKRMILPVNSRIRVEVGSEYVQMITSLIRWLSGRA